MDLGEGEEAVPVAAVIDEGRLQRRLDPRHLGEIDVSGDLPLVDRLEIELVNLGSVHHDHPSLLGMGGVDQHFLGHLALFRRASAPVAQGARAGREGCVLFWGALPPGRRATGPGHGRPPPSPLPLSLRDASRALSCLPRGPGDRDGTRMSPDPCQRPRQAVLSAQIRRPPKADRPVPRCEIMGVAQPAVAGAAARNQP